MRKQFTTNTVIRTIIKGIFATRKSPVNSQMLNVNRPHSRGSLLLELLVAISILAIILSIGSQAVWVSLQSGKTSAESDVAMGLASEAMESVRAIADEKWQNIYNLTKGTQYHTAQSGTKWATSTASEVIALNTASYTRYFVINNVSRDPSTRMIDTTYNSVHDDPNTQRVVVTVSWNGAGSPITISDYFFRYRNKLCNQTDWSGGASVNGVATCGSGTTYDSISPAGTVNTTGGTLMLQ